MQLFEERDVIEILKLKVPDLQCNDKLTWIGNKRGVFTVKSCFKVNFGFSEEFSGKWIKLWGLDILERLKVFIWRIANNILPTREVLQKRFNEIDTVCSICGKEAEYSLTHLFRECQITRLLAFRSKWGLGMGNCENGEDLVGVGLDPNMVDLPQGVNNQFISVFWVTLFYCVWNYRNGMLFASGKRLEETIADFENMVEDMSMTVELPSRDRRQAPKIAWTPPRSGFLKINTDASFKEGNAALAMCAEIQKAKSFSWLLKFTDVILLLKLKSWPLDGQLR